MPPSPRDTRRARSGPTGLAMLGALHRDDVRARRCRLSPPSSPWRSGPRVHVGRSGTLRPARGWQPPAARASMRLVPSLSIERAEGSLRYRLDVPERDLHEPILEEFRHPLDEVTLRALLASAEALLRSPESAGFAQEAQARGQVLYRTLVPPRLREKLRGRLRTAAHQHGAVRAALGAPARRAASSGACATRSGSAWSSTGPCWSGPPARLRAAPARPRHRLRSARRPALRAPRGGGDLRDARGLRRHRLRGRPPRQLRDRVRVPRRGLRPHPLLRPHRHQPGDRPGAAPRRRASAHHRGHRGQRRRPAAGVPERLRQRARQPGAADRCLGSDRVERRQRLPVRRRGRGRSARSPT